jgi:hypothetical protein
MRTRWHIASLVVPMSRRPNHCTLWETVIKNTRPASERISLVTFKSLKTGRDVWYMTTSTVTYTETVARGLETLSTIRIKQMRQFTNAHRTHVKQLAQKTLRRQTTKSCPPSMPIVEVRCTIRSKQGHHTWSHHSIYAPIHHAPPCCWLLLLHHRSERTRQWNPAALQPIRGSASLLLCTQGVLVSFHT